MFAITPIDGLNDVPGIGTTHVWSVSNWGSVYGIAVLLFTFAPDLQNQPAFDTATAPPGSELLSHGKDANGSWYEYVAVPINAGESADLGWTYLIPPCLVFKCIGATRSASAARHVGGVLPLHVNEDVPVVPTVIGQFSLPEWVAISGSPAPTILTDATTTGMSDFTKAVGRIANMTPPEEAGYLTGIIYPHMAEAVGNLAQSLAQGQAVQFSVAHKSVPLLAAPSHGPDLPPAPKSGGPAGQSAPSSLANFVFGTGISGDNNYSDTSLGTLQAATANGSPVSAFKGGDAPSVAIGGGVRFGGGETLTVGNAATPTDSTSNPSWGMASVWDDTTAGNGINQMLAGITGALTLHSPGGTIHAAGFPWFVVTSAGNLISDNLAFTPLGSSGFARVAHSSRRDGYIDPNSNDFINTTSIGGHNTESTNGTAGSNQLFNDLHNTAGLVKDAAGNFTDPDPSILGTLKNLLQFFHGAHHIVSGEDPNDITAMPAGAGKADWITNQPITYRVNFFNEPKATASAFNIVVKLHLDSHLDAATLQPGDSSFPGTQFTFDPATRIVTWILPNIDLPPDTVPPNGEAWVSFSVSPNHGLKTGAAIHESAQVFFDFVPPISTPSLTRTVDASAPKVALSVGTRKGNTVSLDWKTRTTVPISQSSVYVSENGRPYALWTRTNKKIYKFFGKTGRSYRFFVQVQDVAGLSSAAPPKRKR